MAEPGSGGDAIDIPDSLKERVGPLPLGIWIVAIAGGLGIAWLVRSRYSGGSAAEPTAPGISTDTQPGAGNLGDDEDEGSDTPVNARPTTNEEWYGRGVDTLLGTNFGYSPALVATALTKYLEGVTLTQAEQAIVSQTIRLIGPPPYPPPLPEPGNPGPPKPEDPKPSTPKPSTPKPKPVTKTGGSTWHTVKRGESIASIARKYGIAASALYAWNINPKVRTSGVRARMKRYGTGKVLPTGTKVAVPIMSQSTGVYT
jgi:LysM repeat protein